MPGILIQKFVIATNSSVLFSYHSMKIFTKPEKRCNGLLWLRLVVLSVYDENEDQTKFDKDLLSQVNPSSMG